MRYFILTTTNLLGCSLCLLFAQTAPLADVLERFRWESQEVIDMAGKYPAAAFTDGQMFVDRIQVDGDALNIDYTKSEPLQVTIRTLGPSVASKITAKRYAITGTIKYEDVASGSYLEMWSYFAPASPGAPEGAFFSRTLGDSGPMAKMEGTDEGHDFVLPFDATGTTAKLERLEFNLHLTGSGHVHLANVRLVQYPDGPNHALVHIPAVPASSASRIILAIGGPPDNTALTYTLDGVSYPDLGTVQDALKARHASNPQTELVIKAEERVPYEVLQSALQAGANAGVPEVVIVEAMRSPTVTSTAGAGAPSIAASEIPFTKVGEIVEGQQTRALELIWFCLGIATTALTLLVIAGLIFVSRFLQRRNHERELRRIASLDS